MIKTRNPYQIKVYVYDHGLILMYELSWKHYSVCVMKGHDNWFQYVNICKYVIITTLWPFSIREWNVCIWHV